MSEDVPVPPEVIALIPKIGADAFAVWVYLKRHATSDGYIDASYGAICEGVGFGGRSRLSTALKMLVAFDLLKKRKNFNAAVSYQVVTPGSSPKVELLQPVVLIQDTNLNTLNTTIDINTIEDREEVLASQNRTTATSSPKTGLLQRDQWQRMNDAQQAEYAFQKATNMVSIPSRKRDTDIQDIGKMITAYGLDETILRMRNAYNDWITRRNQNGGMYSKSHTGWLDWAVAGEAPPISNGAIGGASLPTRRTGAIERMKARLANGEEI